MFQLLREKLASLSVHPLINDVVKDVLDTKVTVLAAPTGSGKSMLLPSALADATGDQVVVLVPRRFLATDAACNVAELSGTPLGEEVGFALGQVNGEKSLHNPTTKLLFCTYGYALRSGLINKARTIVLDEVHEGDEHISLARAVLHERKKQEPGLRILEMSATVTANVQAAFWSDIADTTVINADGMKLPCEFLHEPTMKAGNEGRSIEDVVIDLLENGHPDRQWTPRHQALPKPDDNASFSEMLDQVAPIGKGSNGIAVFRGGVKEVEDTVIRLKALLTKHHIRNVEVVGIHGNTPSDERRAARRAPKEGWRKIIVGTNVIESGVNLLWVDAGVSDGVRKVPHDRADTGASALVEEDLPQSGIIQQMGRINRNAAFTGFDRGIFILHAKNGFDTRRKQNGPAIEHESILEPAFHAASLGYDPTQLKWDVGHEHRAALKIRLEQARQDLMRLELIRDDWSLTPQGHFIRNLPVSPATGAMLNEAHHLDVKRLRNKEPSRVLRDAILIAAITESRSFKADSKKGHKGDQHQTSDLIDAMNAYRNVVIRATNANLLAPVLEKTSEAFLANATEPQLTELAAERTALATLCGDYNINLNGFIQVSQLVREISERLNAKDKGITLQPISADEKYDPARYDELKRCMLNGNVNQLYQFEHGGLRDLLRDHGNNKRDNGDPFSGYEIADSSILRPNAPEHTLVTGKLRELRPNRRPAPTRDKKNDPAREPLLVISNASIIPPEVFITWAKDRNTRSNAIADPIITDAHLSPDGKLHANYAGKSRFEIPIPQHLRPEAMNLVSENTHHSNGHESNGNGHSAKHKKNKGDRWAKDRSKDTPKSPDPAFWLGK